MNKRNTKISKTYQDLNSIVTDTYESLISNIILQISKDSYLLYGNYAIIRDVDNNSVEVHRKKDDRRVTFWSLKLAVLWSIMDHNCRFYEAQRLIEIDCKMPSLEIEMRIHKKLLNQDFLLHSNNIQYDLDRHKKYNLEINKYIRLADTLQKRNVKNEIN